MSERVEVDISIIKECRDVVRDMWENMMSKVREIRSTSKVIELESMEGVAISYTIGCVDLMDILIEQKIQLQTKEAAHIQAVEHKKKTDDEQTQIKEKQFIAYQQLVLMKKTV